MRRGVGAGLALCILIAASIIARPAQASTTDWTLIVIKAGRSPSDIGFPRIDIRGLSDGRGSLVYGYGVSYKDFSGVFTYGVRSDAIYISGAGDAGRLRQRIATPNLMEDWVPYSAFWTSRLRPGETLAMLFFLANGRINHFEVRPPPASGDATTFVRTGRGSTAVLLADPRNSGIAAATGSLAVADVQRRLTLRTGVVGGVGWVGCVYCTGAWSGPGRQHGRWEANGHAMGTAATGDTSFAGPPGAWRWDQTGATNPYVTEPITGISTPLLAAWAPVGTLWRYFR